MSSLYPQQDLCHEASARRARKVETWVRDQARRREARRAARRRPRVGLRIRAVELLARLMGVADDILVLPDPQWHHTAR
jgi:hypothetical protein